MRIDRRGVTLPELIISSWLFALVLLGLARFASAQAELTARSHQRLRSADFTRTMDMILGRELRGLARGDVAVAPDSVRIRAVRGGGVICIPGGTDVTIRYSGVRWPDPDKDSVLVITGEYPEGRAHTLLTASSDGRCEGGVRLVLDPPPPPAGLVLVFETGSYHLSSGGLRYRRGGGGRQPVTEGILAHGSFGARPGQVEARIELHPDSLPGLPSAERLHTLRLPIGEGPAPPPWP